MCLLAWFLGVSSHCDSDSALEQPPYIRETTYRERELAVAVYCIFSRRKRGYKTGLVIRARLIWIQSFAKVRPNLKLIILREEYTLIKPQTGRNQLIYWIQLNNIIITLVVLLINSMVVIVVANKSAKKESINIETTTTLTWWNYRWVEWSFKQTKLSSAKLFHELSQLCCWLWACELQ